MRSAVSAVALGRDVRPRECPFRTAIDRRRRELAEKRAQRCGSGSLRAHGRKHRRSLAHRLGSRSL